MLVDVHAKELRWTKQCEMVLERVTSREYCFAQAVTGVTENGIMISEGKDHILFDKRVPGPLALLIFGISNPMRTTFAQGATVIFRAIQRVFNFERACQSAAELDNL